MLRLRMMSVGVAACVMLAGTALGQGQQPTNPRQPEQPRQPGDQPRTPDRPDRPGQPGQPDQPDRPGRQPGQQPGQEDQMSKWKVGQDAPEFNLTDLDGTEHSLEKYQDQVLVLVWWNPECEHVERQFTEGAMQTLPNEFRNQQVTFLAINSTQEGEEGGGRVASTRGKTEMRMTMPILLDMEGEAAKEYHVQKAPTVFVIDKEGKLAYAGAIDDSKSGQPARNNYLRDAITAVVSDGTVTRKTTKVEEGCDIKAKGGTDSMDRMPRSPREPREPRTPNAPGSEPRSPGSPTSPN